MKAILELHHALQVDLLQPPSFSEFPIQSRLEATVKHSLISVGCQIIRYINNSRP